MTDEIASARRIAELAAGTGGNGDGPTSEEIAFGVDLDATLLLVESLLRRWVVFPDEAGPVAVALWVVHTYIVDHFDASPYLAVTSPEKRSGKTRLLDVLELVVARAWRVISPSEAVVYRKIQADVPTLLLDEVDAIFGPKAPVAYEGLRALLNAGHRAGTTVPRCVGEGTKIAVQDFSVYCPKAIAGIGKLPDTVADRSIPIHLRRRRREEPVERFRYREALERTRQVARDLATWSETADLTDSRPALPDELDDRAADFGNRSSLSPTRPAASGRAALGLPPWSCRLAAATAMRTRWACVCWRTAAPSSMRPAWRGCRPRP